VLVTTLTKRMAEDLTEYLRDLGIRVKYMHSDIDTIERMELIRDLRRGEYDVLVGINLLREGLDLPEVSLVAILDADKEGFLRSNRSLIQTAGRAARNLRGRVIMYADNVTGSMKECIDETLRRRRIQEAYNEQHGITPRGIFKKIHDVDAPVDGTVASAPGASAARAMPPKERARHMVETMTPDKVQREIKKARDAMAAAAKELKFEEAAELRDLVRELEAASLGLVGARRR
jgi:excinuclease ABC subunit B